MFMNKNLLVDCIASEFELLPVHNMMNSAKLLTVNPATSNTYLFHLYKVLFEAKLRGFA